jgi:DNA-binding MarR family transcriptional regulator
MPDIKIIKGHNQFDQEIAKLVPLKDINTCTAIVTQAYISWYRAFVKTIAPFQLTVPQWMVLHSFLFSGSPMLPSELAKRLPIEGTSISTVLDGIEERGYIKRRRSKIDKRTVHVFLTKQGYDVLRESEAAVTKLCNHIYGPFSPTERKSIIRLSRNIRDAAIIWNGKNPAAAERILKLLTEINQGDRKTVKKRSTKISKPKADNHK